MPDKDLTLRMGMETSRARDELGRFVALHKRSTAQMSAADADAETLRRELFGGTHQQLLSLEGKSAAARKAASDQGVAGFTAMAASAAVLTAGMNAALNMARLMGDAVNRAGEKSRELASKFSGQREKDAELAGLMGRTPDNAFALEMARFNASTGFTPEEGRGFLTELYNAGAQYKGTDKALGQTMAAGEFQQFGSQTGRLALALGLNQRDVATMAGSMAGFTDFNQFGDQASEQALGMTARSINILQSGAGDQGILMREFKKIASGALSESALKGVFHTPEDVAIAESLATEKGGTGEGAGNLVLATARALREPKGKLKDFREKMGIGLGTDYLKAIQIMAEKVPRMAEAMGEGATTTDVFKSAGFGIREAEGLAVSINNASKIEARRAKGAEFAGTQPALDLIGEYEGSERGLLRKRKAETDLAEAERGAENSRLEIGREEARRNLIRDRKIDQGSLLNAAGNALPFSLVGDRNQALIDAEFQKILIQRMGSDDAPWSDLLNVSPLAREADLNRRMSRMDAAGINPLTGDHVKRLVDIEEEKNRDRKSRPGPPLPARPADRFIYLPR